MTRFLLFVALAAGLVPSVRAQDDPVLPDLAPREIEITGELAIRFPSLRRQPLLGFNPPPRIPDVPQGRRPYAEEYLQRRADLPATPLRSPISPAVSPYASGLRFDGSVEAGVGRYAQRYVELDLASGSRSRSLWRIQADYEGRSGFVPQDAVDGRSSAYDLGRIGARFETPVASWRIGAAVDGALQRYALYAAEPGPTVAPNAAPDRDGRFGSATAWSERHGTDWRLRLGATLSASRVNTDVFDETVRLDPRTERTDASGRFDLRLETGAVDRGLSLSGQYEGVGLDGSGPVASGWQTGAGTRFPLGSTVRVTAGLAALGMSAGREATGSGDRSLVWIAPDFRIETTRPSGLRLSAENRPSVVSARLDALYRANPFAVDSPWIEAELRPIDAAVRGEASLGRLELSAAGRWNHSPNRRYFLHTAEHFSGYVRGLSEVRHGRVRELGVDLDAGAYLGAGIRIRMGATVRSARLTGFDIDVPHVAPWSIRALASAGFDGRRGLVQLVGRVEGPRTIDLEGSRSLDPYADVDLSASYRVAPAATAVVRLQNLAGNRPEWYGYVRPSPVFTAGLRWQF